MNPAISLEMNSLLELMVAKQASDLHLSAGLPPMLRVLGDLQRVDTPSLTHETVHRLVTSIMSEPQRVAYAQHLECDLAYEVRGLSRFRVNAFQQNRGAAAVLRAIPSVVPSLAQLGAPAIFTKLAGKPRGLVLVTGPTGSGKSTTLAAMVDHINEHEPAHILTVEDPIEFVHPCKKSLVHQREVATHTHSFSAALKSALREDPDTILVGELRDLETIRLALTAAETGHLVLGTLHTSSAAKTIDRLVDVFEAAEKELIRSMLSESLEAVITQTLCKTADGRGRVAAHEIMLGTPAIRNLIRENKIPQMYSAIQTGQSLGMQTLDQSLAELVKTGAITAAEARSKARFPEKF